ncbi:diguanylate cyclase [Marinobacter sp. AN1]|uniref:diguanylate cyclase n=1 Tax=Marinobacter sp. AN1 TaxID=2886046 RepID=UPI002230B510|nr:diguanylate cyclase [Marinobacter sp. AN1]UZD65490.1 diguanylate cyclase [Marinobacter sp. AN1]
MPASTRVVPQSIDVPSGYRFVEKITEGGNTRIYRALRASDGESVVIKTLKPEQATRESIALLQHEHEILRDVKGSYLIQAHELTRIGDLPALVLEDIGGQSLDRITAHRRINLKACVGIATAIATALKHLHARSITHKDINPANILVNSKSRAIRLIDFGIATHQQREQANLKHPTTVPGTPGYMSPEQTGRMNRAVDYRSDFYSLGATLYELVTGRPMFSAEEPIEWFHCHIARTPVAPADLDSSVPRVLSDLIMKLLAKTAEQRYQSAGGLLYDLQLCYRQINANASIDPFPLGRHDVPDHFRIPQRLYGREKEVQQLLTAFEQAYDRVALALVAGRSGIGKSSLINELHKPVTARRGYFTVGKFDLVHRDVPYSGLTVALRDLVQQVLTESDERLAYWRNRITGALGPNGVLMTELIPELELIIGPQPGLSAVGAAESEQRFRLTLFNFIRVFSHADHPLVLVLDDLQWADSSTLQLADLLVDQLEGDRLLVVGAYRDNEVTPDHPLMSTLQQMQDTNVYLTHIALQPLGVPDICRLLSDTLMTTTGEVEVLARVVHQKTEGNPFFVEEFLEDQHGRGHITYDPAASRWVWDITRLSQQRITDNVAGLMTRKLESLPGASLELLRLASCAGSRFSLAMLSMITGQSPGDIAIGLDAPTRAGLVTPVRDSYQLTELAQATDAGRITVEFAFTHDRIQEAAYQLVDADTRQATHLEIGRQLLHNLDPVERKDRLFATVTHLNIGAGLIDNREDRRELCRLNLEAGYRARQAASYPIAYNHFQKAVLLLGEHGWEEDYALALSAYSAAAEAAAYVGDRKGLKVLVDTGLEQARDLLGRVSFHETWMSYLITQGELHKAIDIALPLLAELGHKYPRHPRRSHVTFRFLRLKSRLKTVNLEALRNRPDLSSAEQRAAGRIGASIGSATMFAEPMLLPLLCIRGVEMALEYGHSPETTTSFSVLGMMYARELHDAETGNRLGKLAVDLSERFNIRRGRALHLYAALIQHWKDPLNKTFDNLRQASRMCMENGDFEYAVHAATIQGDHLLHGGADLEKLEQQTTRELAEFRALHMGSVLHHHEARLQFIRNLRGQSTRPAELSGDVYDIHEMLPRHREAADNAIIEHALLKSMYLHYLFDGEGYQEHSARIVDYLTGTGYGTEGFYTSRWTRFLRCLVLLHNARTVTATRQRRRYLGLARKDLRLMRAEARNCPVNMANKYQLLQAEFLRYRGRDFDAHEAYDQAIALAAEQGFIEEQALACQLCGTMHVNAGRTTISLPYLSRARDLYRRWGAHALVRHLEQRHPQLAESRATTSQAGTLAMPMAEVDMMSLMKALKAIADEQIHSRMVESIINIALEFAGAQRGILALRDGDGQLRIESEASVDSDETVILQSSPLEQCESVSQATVNYVSRTRESVVVADALSVNSPVPGLDREEYILRERVRSILCLPIAIGQGEQRTLIGLLYLENNHISNCFTKSRIGALEIISVAAAGRLELSRKAAVDGLTNLFNHDYFQNMLRQELAGVARFDREMSLVIIDIDHFKQFNVTWGHQLGDQVLREVANLVKANSRENDTAARYGGEEMVVILPGAGRDEASVVAERIRAAIERHQVKVDDEVLGVTVSLGLATASAMHADPERLIRKADTALYKSKANGRNQLTVAD